VEQQLSPSFLPLPVVSSLRSYRPTFWEIEDKEKLKERSLRRVKHLLGVLSVDQVEEEVPLFPFLHCS